jgi:hypothetical protein
MESDPQPNEEVTSANTELNTLTDRLEADPTPVEAPTRDVQTFWNRLDSLMEHLEVSNQHRSRDKLRSFTNQPERVCISSDNDINTAQTQDAIAEQSFSSFRVAISRPFLDVKSIQLLRASIPNAVTNIPDEECVFWYYRLPAAIFSGTISVTASGGYTSATFTTAGVITPVVPSPSLVSITPSFPAVGLATYFLTSLSGLVNGSTVTVAGVTPSGYNGNFTISDISIPNVSFRVVNATTGVEDVTSATLTQTITDYIDWGTVPYSLKNAAGVVRGYFTPPTTSGGSSSIYVSNTLTGGTIGTITRSGDAFMPAPAAQYLHMIRLLPSYYKAELFESGFGQDSDLPPASLYGFNKTFKDYEDLAAELAKSCSDDPAYDIAEDQGISPFNLFIPNDISITYNETLNKFIFTGNNAFDAIGERPVCFYLSSGFLDPLLWVTGDVTEAAEAVSAPTMYNYLTNIFPGDYGYIRSIKGQPFQLYRTLNLRLGFTWNGVYSTSIFPLNITALEDAQLNASTLAVFLNRLRPVPGYYNTSALTGPAVGQTSPTTTETYTADSYANLVSTNTVSLYADFTGGSTYDSMANTQLLACVPMNASNLGVTFYNTTLYCPLTKISDQIYEIEIRMLTDTGVPYVIPNSAIVSLELALTY